MVVSAITPNAPDLNGKVVKIFMAFTSGGGTDMATLTLPTDAPNIDLTVENPVLKVALITTETDPVNSEIGTLALQVKRNASGTNDPDSTAEWKIMTARTVGFYETADEDGIGFLQYIGYGSQQQ